ncbi:MAG: HEAT repeat domain-containing protein [Phycisphaerales bacterium]|nr:HEAT repeat domain-containing protein [Phycisphaerales bacterium]
MRIHLQSPVAIPVLLTLCGALGACSGSGGRVTDSRTVSSAPAAVANQRSQSNGAIQARSNRELKEVAVEMLLELSTDVSPEIRANALEALQGHTESLESVAALGLSDRNEGVRSVAAMVAGKQNLKALRPMLEVMTTESSPFVRASALFATSKISRSRSDVDISPLSAMLLDSDDIRVSSHAAFVLGELGNESAVPLLKQAGSRTWGQTAPIQRQLFRLQIAEALIKLGQTESMDSVRSALYPSRPEELEATALAVQIIGEVRDRGAIDQLIYLVDEDTSRPMPAEVRLGVAGALGKLGLREGGFIADEYAQNSSPVIRAQAAVVYGRTGRREHLPKLEMMLLDESAQVRAGSAGAILEILGTR